jgi:hypothetical protein
MDPVARIGLVGWLPALGTRDFQRPLSDPSTDPSSTLPRFKRDGRDVQIADVHRGLPKPPQSTHRRRSQYAGGVRPPPILTPSNPRQMG